MTALTERTPLRTIRAVATPAPPGRRWRGGTPHTLAGLALAAALLPLRGSWAVGIVLVALALTVPGLLALRALRISPDAIGRYPVYIPVASLFVLIAGGLGADLIAPLLGVARPLHGDTTALTVIAIGVALWFAGGEIAPVARLRIGELLERPSTFAPLLLPALSGIGAQLLTNGHGALVARAGGVLTVVAVLALLLAAPRLSRRHVAVALFASALAAEWAIALRSQEIVGYDIATEVMIAHRTLVAGVWHTAHHGDAYSSMLSVTILPAVLHALTGCSPLIAFKVLYPVLSALLPVSVFLMGERFLTRRYAAVAGALLVIQDYFFEQLPQLARQEIALLFFAVLLFALIDARLRRRSQIVLAVGAAAGLIVSHYSSTYLAIPAIVVAVALALIAGRIRRPTGIVAVLACSAVVLVGGSALWNGAITHSASNVTSFVSALRDRGLDLVPSRNGSIVSSYFVGTLQKTVSGPEFQRLAVHGYAARRGYIHPLAQASQARYVPQTATVPVAPQRFAAGATAVKLVNIVVEQLILVAAVLGGLLLVLRRRGSELERRIGVLALSTLGLLVLMRFSGTISASYNQTRALLQSLLMLALPAAWLAQAVLGRLRLGWLRTAGAVGLAIAVAVTFAYQDSVGAVLFGGGNSLAFWQSGEVYERNYMTPAELAGATWAVQRSRRTLLYADPYAQLRLAATSGAVALQSVTPETLDRRAWVYGSHTNTVLGRARGKTGDAYSVYDWPNAFLNRYFDIVYDNGDSKVYHR